MEAIAQLLQQADGYIDDEAAEREQIQHLAAFGYLDPQLLDEFSYSHRLAKARSLFINELNRSGLFDLKYLASLKRLYADDWDRFILRRLADIDEGIKIKALPRSGEVSLISRLNHYRLDLLGLFEFPVHHAFSEISRQGLLRLASFARTVDPVDTINLMADVESFTRRMIRFYGYEKFIIVIRLKGTPGNLPDVSHTFKKRLRDDFERSSTFYQKFKEKVLFRRDKKVDYHFLNRIASDEINLFIVRLIQIHQWKNGLYEGLLDSDLGPVSLQSILDAIDLFNRGDQPEVRQKEVLAYAGNRYVLFNALHFLQFYMVEDNNREAEVEIAQKLGEQLRTAGQEEKKIFAKNAETALSVAKNEIDSEAKKTKNGIFRRIYFGVKSFFKNLLKFADRIFDWIVTKFKKFAGLLTGFFKKILHHAKEVIRYLVKGIKFLIGRAPFVHLQDEALQYTKIRIDGDALNLIDQDTQPEDLKLHLDDIKETVRAMDFSLFIVASVIRLTRYFIGAAFTWPLLIIQLIKIFKTAKTKYVNIYSP